TQQPGGAVIVGGIGRSLVKELMPALALERPVDVLVAEEKKQQGAEEGQEKNQQDPGDGGTGFGLGHQHPGDAEESGYKAEEAQKVGEPIDELFHGVVLWAWRAFASRARIHELSLSGIFFSWHGD